jgi:hypothetical protein
VRLLFKVPVRYFLFIFHFFCQSVLASRENLTEPSLGISSYIHQVSVDRRFFPSSGGEIIEGTDCSKVLQVISFADRLFAILGWPQSFIDGRFPIAQIFADRSSYYRIGYYEFLDGKIQIRETYATIGETHSYFSLADIEALGPERLLKHRKWLLPMEDTHKKLVTRYYDSRGRGVILEFRTKAGTKEVVPWLRDNIRNQILFEEVRMAIDVVREYPELYEKPVIYTYADEKHVRLYRLLGFEIQTDLTPVHQPIWMKDDETGAVIRWWYLAVTPKRFEANLFSLRGGRVLEGLNQPHPVKISNGTSFFAAAHTLVGFDPFNRVTAAQPTEEVELETGLFVAAGTRVRWDMGFVMWIKEISRPYLVHLPEGSLTFPARSWVGFQPTQFSDPADADKVSRNRFDVRNNEAYLLTGSNITVAPTASVIVDRDNSTLKIARIKNDVDFGSGIIAAGGTSLQVGLQNGKYMWHRLTLAQDVVMDGKFRIKGGYLINDSAPQLQF